jgi:amidase
VPIAAGLPFAFGSRALPPGIAPPADSELMRRFRAAGLATLGVTTTPELALSFATESVKHGPTRNPWDLSRGVGGSSGGAAALVAAGAVPVAHGSDGAGSIRIPASCCGVVGLKPSRGRIPCGPAMGEAAFGTSYDFVLTRTVRDTALLLDLLQGPAPGDRYPVAPVPRAAEPHPLRVAVTTTAWSGDPVDPAVAAVTEAAARTLADLGHEVTDASPTVDWETHLVAMRLGFLSMAVPFLTAPRQPRPEDLEAMSHRVLDLGRTASALDVCAMLDAQNRVSRSVGAFFTGYDLLVTPTLAQPPAPHGTFDYDDPAYTVDSWFRRLSAYGPFASVLNQTGQPAISLPLGRSADGLPIGVQVVAATGREDLLLAVAFQLEEAMPWPETLPASKKLR